MGMMDDAIRDTVRDKKNEYEDKIFDDDYLAKVKERIRTSDGDFVTVGVDDMHEIKKILNHLIKKIDKISGM
tara:strand:+ start:7859 stop:8074 length:216 start_codon:yes stop_codon:yes gene_type:complete